jgi:hypothetical protein
MSVMITTYDDRIYEVSDKTAEAVSQAMADSWQHINLSELGVVLAIKDIRRMDNVYAGGPELPSGKSRFSIPREHDTVVMDEDNQVIRSYKLGGFYSEEAMAQRRAENKAKYAPGKRPK